MSTLPTAEMRDVEMALVAISAQCPPIEPSGGISDSDDWSTNHRYLVQSVGRLSRSGLEHIRAAIAMLAAPAITSAPRDTPPITPAGSDALATAEAIEAALSHLSNYFVLRGDPEVILQYVRALRAENERLKAERDEYYSRAASLVFHLPPETLAGDVQKWRDEFKADRDQLRAENERLTAEKNKLGNILTWIRKRVDESAIRDSHTTLSMLIRKLDEVGVAAARDAELTQLRASLSTAVDALELFINKWNGGYGGLAGLYEASVSAIGALAQLRPLLAGKAPAETQEQKIREWVAQYGGVSLNYFVNDDPNGNATRDMWIANEGGLDAARPTWQEAVEVLMEQETRPPAAEVKAEDTTFLDWLETNRAEIDTDGPGFVIYTENNGLGYGASNGRHSTLRAAIRAAIANVKAEESI